MCVNPNSEPPLAPPLTSKQHWRLNLRLTSLLLVLWFGVTFGMAFFARELNQFTFMGFPLGFYMAAQGTLLINAALVAVYVLYLNYLDRRAGVPEDRDA